MDKDALIVAYGDHLQMHIHQYELAIDRATELLRRYRSMASTHLGHNLAVAAAELSVIAASIEADKIAISSLKSDAVPGDL